MDDTSAHEPQVTGEGRGRTCYAALLAYSLGTAALAGGAPRELCAALALPLLASLGLELLAVPRGPTRRLLVASLALAALGVLASDLSSGLSLAAATQRGHLIRLLWSSLAVSTLGMSVGALVPVETLRLAWRRFGERSWSLRSAVAGASAGVAGASLVLAWLVGDYPWGPDVGVHVTDAMRVREGRVPYLDFYTLYHAGNLYVQGAWLAVLGPLTSTTLAVQIVLQHAVVATGLAIVLRVRLGLGGTPLALAIATYTFFVPALEGLFLMLEPMASCSGWAALALASLVGRRLRAPGHDLAALLGGFLIGLLAFLALATKQVGGVFLVAVPLVHVDAGRLVRPVLAAQLAGALLLPALFFGAHPGALPIYWQQNVLGLFSYAQGTLAPREPLGAAVQHLARNALLPLALAGGLGLCLSELRERGRPGAWGDSLLLGAGALLIAPSLVRPYLHYYLLPLPFVVFALALLARRAAIVWSARCLLPAALALLVFGLTPIAHHHARTLGRDAGAARQRAVLTFMTEHLAGRTRSLILPSSPEYYLLTSVHSPDWLQLFVHNGADLERMADQLREARDARVPLFIVDRGDPMLDECRARVRELGWVKRAEGPQVEYWACD